jgi:general secretion pathway protein I
MRARGFTLIEVLVALAIVAIGMAAVLSTIGSSAETASYLRDKTFAQWIALNQLAQLRLSTTQQQLPSQGTTEGELDYAGHHWHWQQIVSDAGFPGMLRIDVKVQQTDTAAGKSAPYIGNAIGIVGDALAQPQSMSIYQEYTPVAAGQSSSSSGNGLMGSPGSQTTTGTAGVPASGNTLGTTTPSQQ